MTHDSVEEKEIKVQVDENIFKDKIKELESKNIVPKVTYQTDIYFDTSEMKLSNLNRGLRVRFNGDTTNSFQFKSLFKRPDNLENPWFIEEINFSLPMKSTDIEQFTQLLKRLSFSELTQTNINNFEDLEKELNKHDLKVMVKVRKHRTEFEDGSNTYVFDHIESLGYFIEIETTKGDPIQIMSNFINTESINPIRSGYNDMLSVNIPNYLTNEEKQSKFVRNHDWNVLPTETELVKNYFSKE